MGFDGMIPSGYVKIAMENGPVEIVSFPINNGDLPGLCVFARGYSDCKTLAGV